MASSLKSALTGLRQRLIDQKARDAVRFAIQSAAAAAAAFAAARALGMEEYFIAVITAVLIVQPSVGSTASTAWNRLFATLVGSGVGLALIYVMPGGWGTAAALALAMGAMGLIAAFQADWRYGVVPAAAIALGYRAESLSDVLERGYAVGLGVGIGLAVSLVVFGQSAQGRARLHLKDALNALADRLDLALCRARGDTAGPRLEAGRNYHTAIEEARAAADAARGDASGKIGAVIASVERLDGAVTILIRALGDGSGFESEDRRALLKRLRETAVSAIRALVDDRIDLDAEIAAFDACLDEARATLGTTGAQDGQNGHAAFVFGLTALRESLVETARALAEQPGTAHGLKKARIITAEALPRRSGFTGNETGR